MINPKDMHLRIAIISFMESFFQRNDMGSLENSNKILTVRFNNIPKCSSCTGFVIFIGKNAYRGEKFNDHPWCKVDDHICYATESPFRVIMRLLSTPSETHEIEISCLNDIDVLSHIESGEENND